MWAGHMPVIPALRRLRKEDGKLETRVGFIVRLSVKIMTAKNVGVGKWYGGSSKN
jgi:hypothetical protein